MPAVQPAPTAPGASMQRRHSSASSDGTGSDHGLSGSSRHVSNLPYTPTTIILTVLTNTVNIYY